MYGDGDPNYPLYEDFEDEESSEDPELDEKLARAATYLTAKAAGVAVAAVAAVPVRVPVPFKRNPGGKQTGLYAGPAGFLGPQRDPKHNTLQSIMSGAQKIYPMRRITGPPKEKRIQVTAERSRRKTCPTKI